MPSSLSALAAHRPSGHEVIRKPDDCGQWQCYELLSFERWGRLFCSLLLRHRVPLSIPRKLSGLPCYIRLMDTSRDFSLYLERTHGLPGFSKPQFEECLSATTYVHLMKLNIVCAFNPRISVSVPVTITSFISSIFFQFHFQLT